MYILHVQIAVFEIGSFTVCNCLHGVMLNLRNRKIFNHPNLYFPKAFLQNFIVALF
jgi:hypothetical protein